MTNEKRMKIEKFIVKMTVNAMLNAGYEISVIDGSESCTRSGDKKAILRAADGVDEVTLHALRPSNGLRPDLKQGAVYLVFGNDGWDVIADYSVSLEDLLAGVNAYADKIEAYNS